MLIKYSKDSEVHEVFTKMVELNYYLCIYERKDCNVLYIPDTFNSEELVNTLYKYDSMLNNEDSFGMYGTTTFLIGYFKGLFKSDITI